MSTLTFLAGAAHWSVYGMIFASIVLISISTARRVSRWLLVQAGLITALAYFMPIVLCGGTMVILAIWFGLREIEFENAERARGAILFSYDFFGDNRFTGWSLKRGASHLEIPGNSEYVPEYIRVAAEKAMCIDPFRPDGRVIVRTEVTMGQLGPVITDYVTTPDQFVRRKLTGMWEKPEDYQRHQNWIKTLSDPSDANGTIDERGLVSLPAPKGAAAEFMSQFNGPKLTPVVRK